MTRLSRRWCVWLLLIGCAPEDKDDESASDTGPAGTFPCGDHGGTCDAATELCIVGGADKCSTCVPLPDACDDDSGCGCIPPGTSVEYGTFACNDAGTCAEEGGGRVLTCAEIDWGCG